MAAYLLDHDNFANMCARLVQFPFGAVEYMQAVVNPVTSPDLVFSEMEEQGAVFGMDPEKACNLKFQL